jgi:hypothetical protein
MSEPTPAELAEIAAAELAAGMTAIVPPPPGQLWAVSANGHWDYEPSGRTGWVAWDRRRDKLAALARDVNDARRQTFELDHPLHTVPREPRPSRYSVE